MYEQGVAPELNRTAFTTDLIGMSAIAGTSNGADPGPTLPSLLLFTPLFVPSLSWQIIVFVFRALKNNSWKTVRPLLLLQVSTSRRAGCGRITSAAPPPSGAENGIFF
jgi:hypothetical protein